MNRFDFNYPAARHSSPVMDRALRQDERLARSRLAGLELDAPVDVGAAPPIEPPAVSAPTPGWWERHHEGLLFWSAVIVASGIVARLWWMWANG